MFQKWRRLAFLHAPLDPDALQATLPAGLELDTFEGRAYLGLVPFDVVGARVAGLPPIPGFSKFPELNLRTYVHHRGVPGIWFYTLEATHRLAVALARAGLSLPYRYATLAVTPSLRGTRYTGARPGAEAELEVVPGEELGPALPGSLEFFLIERYALYAARSERLLRLRVHHRPYPLQRATVRLCHETFSDALGFATSGWPLAHWAEGVDVAMFWPERVD